MKIIKSELECVAVRKDQYPEENLPEVVFVGRSNVGKSSLLNCIAGRKGLARVSGSPGKTRTINFYLINDSFRIIDLPGYGYAKVSKAVTADWDRMMGDFFKSRKSLRYAVQLVDIRHEPTKLDISMHDYLKAMGLEVVVCATKNDKVSGNERQKNISLIRKTLSLTKEETVIPVSSLKKTGIDEITDIISAKLFN